MRKIREVLRLRYELGLGHRAIAASCAIRKASVCDYLKRAHKAGLTWQQAEPSERAPRLSTSASLSSRGGCTVSCGVRGVTLQLLWLEYQQATAQKGNALRAYQYSQFCELYASSSTLARNDPGALVRRGPARSMAG
jgi:hypothetical protein